MIKLDDYLVTIDLVAPVKWSAAHGNLLLIIMLQGPKGEPLADVYFVMRVHVMGFADVTRYRHACVFHPECAALLVTDGGPAVILHGLHRGWVVAGSVASLVVGQLDEVEWEIALCPTVCARYRSSH